MRILIPSLAAAAVLFCLDAGAADPQPYSVSIADTGDSQVDGLLRDTSLLVSLRSKVPAPPFALVDRVRGDIGRFETVLESFGYYKASIKVTVDGRDSSDKTLADELEKVPQDESVEIKVAIDRGPRYTLRKVEIEGSVPDVAREALGVRPGDPAIAENVLAGQARLLGALQEDGYAFAKVDPPVAYADDAANVLDVSYKTDTGAQAVIGRISFNGLKEVNEEFLQHSLTIHPGERYRPSAIEAARVKLVALDVFSSISVHPATQADTDGTVPLVFEVEERARHSVALSGSYSTDLGGSLSASWSHHNLLGNAEKLNLTAAGTGIGGDATAGIGFNFAAQLIKPRFLDTDQELEVDLAAVKQHLSAYSQTAETFGLFLHRKFTAEWTGTAGLAATHDDITQEGQDRLYELIALPVTASYDSTGLKDLLADPTHGSRASLSLAPTLALGNKTVVFAVFQASGSIYFDLLDDGRSVLAAKALVGSIQGGSSLSLPPDQRLYAGGGGTVRGFRYQSIGPHFADGYPMGATSVDAFSLEFRQRLWSDYGVVGFLDAGQAGTNSLPFNGGIDVGAGLGVRYYTSIGAVRVDVAVPVTQVPHGDKFEIYVGLGQAF